MPYLSSECAPRCQTYDLKLKARSSCPPKCTSVQPGCFSKLRHGGTSTSDRPRAESRCPLADNTSAARQVALSHLLYTSPLLRSMGSLACTPRPQRIANRLSSPLPSQDNLASIRHQGLQPVAPTRTHRCLLARFLPFPLDPN